MFFFTIIRNRNNGLKTKEEKFKDNKVLNYEEDINPMLHIDLIGIEIGTSLISLVERIQGGNLVECINGVRNLVVIDLGLIIPLIRIRDNKYIDNNEYKIMIKNNLMGNFKIYPDKFLLMNPDNVINEINGDPIIEPAYNISAKWINKEDKENAERLGFTVVDPLSVFSSHLKEIVKKFGHELLTRQETQRLLDDLCKNYPVLISGIIPEKVSLPTIHRILQNLLKEQISIRNLMEIMEIIGDYADKKMSVEELTELVKKELGKIKNKS